MHSRALARLVVGALAATGAVTLAVHLADDRRPAVDVVASARSRGPAPRRPPPCTGHPRCSPRVSRPPRSSQPHRPRAERPDACRPTTCGPWSRWRAGSARCTSTRSPRTSAREDRPTSTPSTPAPGSTVSAHRQLGDGGRHGATGDTDDQGAEQAPAALVLGRRHGRQPGAGALRAGERPGVQLHRRAAAAAQRGRQRRRRVRGLRPADRGCAGSGGCTRTASR